MGLSIITPHYNNSKEILSLYKILSNQTKGDWQWIIIDDFSKDEHRRTLELYFNKTIDKRVNLIFNIEKTNASVCRNKGIDISIYENLVFLDSDDKISIEFVANRRIEFTDFIIFKNTNVITEKGDNILSNSKDSEYLNHFLNAKFIWPITSVLWNKEFLKNIGAFNANLKRLQDVELSIRALYNSNDYIVLNNNSVDFYYCVSDIRNRTEIVKPVCESVYYLINDIIEEYNISTKQKYLIKAYYFLCAKYLERSEDPKNVKFIKPVLKLFSKKGYFSYLERTLALILLNLYQFRLISSTMFLKLNRYFFKTQVKSTNESEN